MAKKRPTGKTPGGVSLSELAESFRKQGVDLPPAIKQLVDEHMPQKPVQAKNKDNKKQSVERAKQAAGPQTVTPEAKEQTPVPATQSTVSSVPEQKPTIVGSQDQKPAAEPEKPTNIGAITKPDTGFARNFIKNLVGKDLANKLIKKSSAEAKREDQREETTGKDIKSVKLTLEELKKTLEAQGKKLPEKLDRKPSATKKFTSAFTGAFKRTAVQPLEKLGYKFERPKALKVDKPKKDKSPTAEKVPRQAAPAMAAQLAEKLAKQKPAIQGPKEAPPPAPMKNEDQSKAENVKTEVVHQKEAKDLHDKLDQVLKELDDIKKKQSGGGILGLIAAGIAGLVALIKPMWNAIKGIVTSIAKIGSWIASKLGTAFRAVKGVAGAAAKAVKSAATKGWQLAKKAEKGAANLIEKGAGKIGIGSKVVRATGKILGAAGAAVDVGMGVYDLAQGKRQTELHGLDYIDPMRLGMRAGEAINQGVAKLSGGEDLSEMISRIPEKVSDMMKPTGPKVAPVPKKLPERVAAASAQNTEMKSAQKAEPNILVIKGGNTTKVIPAGKKSGSLAVQISTRNPESSISRLTSQMFDDPAGYANISRL